MPVKLRSCNRYVYFFVLNLVVKKCIYIYFVIIFVTFVIFFYFERIKNIIETTESNKVQANMQKLGKF